MKLKPVTAGRPPKLRDEDAAARHPAGDKLEKALEKQADRLKQLQ